ncbi:hypothetical protein D3C78_1766650 [compost metagenome]
MLKICPASGSPLFVTALPTLTLMPMQSLRACRSTAMVTLAAGGEYLRALSTRLLSMVCSSRGSLASGVV